MSKRYVLSEYVERAMERALYDKLEGGSFWGRIPSGSGVIAFASTLRACEEDWILVGLRLHHDSPTAQTSI